ncbi:MAG: DUF6529 family protein [Streptosporangiaceae bacterium]
MTLHGASKRNATARLVLIGLIGLAVTATLYFVGRAIVSTPSYSTCFLGETGVGVLSLKSLLATVALGLAVVQVLLALWIYGKLPVAGRAPGRIRLTHRVVGGVALIVTLPVAIHCATAYGVQLTDPRVLVHSIAGCFFYGAFVAKVLLVQSKRLPGWTLPVAGGILAVLLLVLWYTSGLYYYNGYSVPI